MCYAALSALRYSWDSRGLQDHPDPGVDLKHAGSKFKVAHYQGFQQRVSRQAIQSGPNLTPKECDRGVTGNLPLLAKLTSLTVPAVADAITSMSATRPGEFGLQVRLPQRIRDRSLGCARDFGNGLPLRSRPFSASTYRSGCHKGLETGPSAALGISATGSRFAHARLTPQLTGPVATKYQRQVPRLRSGFRQRAPASPRPLITR
jgi:hypothetical protein